MFHKDTIRIGTRKSALALAQSKLVGDAIINSFPPYKNRVCSYEYGR